MMLTDDEKSMDSIRIALAQINPTVGDLDGNVALTLDYMSRARSAGARIVALPELAITGYPPEDLLLKSHFIRDNIRALDRVIAASEGIIVIIGFVDTDGSDIFNAAATVSDGKLLDVYHKNFLPNYGVFDEERYFQAGSRLQVFDLPEGRFGVNICEDIWYGGGPTQTQALLGDAHLIVNISSSPYHAGKRLDRERMLCTRAEDNTVALAYCNLVGGQDELVFDGNSLVINAAGHITARGASFAEDLVIADINTERVFAKRLHDPRRRQDKARLGPDASLSLVEIGDDREGPRTFGPSRSKAGQAPTFVHDEDGMTDTYDIVGEVYSALVVGTRDYVRKNGFDKVYIGLSGGIDSALTAVVAADAVGPESVRTVFMPTRFSSSESARDAAELARNLGVAYHTIPIEPVFEEYLEMLEPVFDGLAPDTTEENLQARIRGNLLMALSNKFRGIVLSTGNKSEMSVGYSTIYGDMVGGYAVLKDVFKTMVFRLALYVNSRGPKPIIPEYIITRPPSAELRDNQTDQDTLPPYPVLDEILSAYIEQDLSAEAIIAQGFDPQTVRWVLKSADSAEYKRRQSAPGIKITPRAFGRDRRMPITNKYHS
jgi:NAD+ synthase (glutamine-hydrolysing)